MRGLTSAAFFCVIAVALGAAACGGSAPEASASAAPADVKALARQSLAVIDGSLAVTGLKEPVEVIRDQWGVPHIYAKNTEDLYFAQGYVMAQDRLWEMEWWRRELEGRLSEVLGPSAFERDQRARLLKYRGTFDEAEWTTYHKDGKAILTAYANGINAFISDHANNLPVEFKLTGIKPLPWTAETVVLREPSFGDAAAELRLAMSVAKLGVKEANRRAAPDPWDDLKVPDGLDVNVITDEVIAATRTTGQLPRPAIVEEYRKLLPTKTAALPLPVDQIRDLGSNNWVIGGAMSPSGKPIVANDPHRAVGNPSLRYIAHLNAPGWNVVGASQPPFVGVSIGHNDTLAWGLTITGTDFQDVFIEDLNPANLNEMMYNGKPEALRIVTEEIPIKGEAPRKVELKYSQHGPIFFVDEKRHKAFALRSAFSEPGTASYLASLKLGQAKDCKEFIALAIAWRANSENLICGDVQGNIGFEASALTPIRKGWLGRLPVPGTGQFEWNGFRTDLPQELNPDRGFIATANHNIHGKGYWPPVMFKTTNTVPYDRITRIMQVIKPGQKFSIDDTQKLQRDVYSLRGAEDVAAFRGWTSTDAAVERARAMVAGWDAMLTKDSVPAAIYITWRRAIDQARRDKDGAAPRTEVEAALKQSVGKLTADLGADWNQWHYGRVHTQGFQHPLLTEFDLPTIERRGGNGAVGADGASYREIIDVADWEKALTINTPGQSAQPESPYYGNLLPLWANDEYFPMLFSRAAVDGKAAHKLELKPR
jgi:penicillin G amidase